MRGKTVWAKKATASEKTSLENDSQKCERVHHFISGVALVSSFHFEVGLQSTRPTLHERQKRPTFSAEERVVLSLQCSMCANFAFFVGLFLKGMRAIMGNSFLGTHCHHSGAAIPRAEVIFAQAKPAGSVPWVTYYHWPRVQISTLDTLQNRSLRTHPYLLLHQTR